MRENRRALRFLFTANAISGFAQGISMLAVPWYFARQGASTTFNLVYALVTFASLFWGMYAGALVDRFDRKQVFLVTNIVEGLILLSVATYGFLTGSVPLPGILLAFTTTVFGYGIHYPNLYAFAQEISRPEDYGRITSTIEIVGQATSVVSGALAALLIEGLPRGGTYQLLGASVTLPFAVKAWPLHQIFLLDGLTYVVAVVLIASIRHRPVQLTQVELGTLWKRLRTGVTYLREHRTIWVFGLFSFSVFVGLLVELNALMPMYIHNHLRAGAGAFGAAEVAYALGALSAGVFVHRLFRHQPPVRSIILLMLLAGLGFGAAAATRSVSLFLAFSLVLGVTNAGTRILRVSYLFAHVPNEVSGRVNSIFNVANVLLRTGFILLFTLPFFARGSHVVWGYAALGAFIVASALVLVTRYRELSTPPVG
ncbi:MFS transporter [Hymenobacter chitinivorans]|uniref:MFS transporter n=1 Tax=Hymenobacter chitinivorans DSM 11115 TaxID=1121954 RepID=A0A2M9ASL2_9BACT|nr:MFS transporter [Hymenobacter chitinivorans]PJJ48682.1 MFS transporter [Hymenobacter chitinivorans DSM 11115]